MLFYPIITSITDDIDGAADNGYNGNNNSVDNGGISDVNVSNQGANSGGFGQPQGDIAGTQGEIKRTREENEGDFLRRVQGGSNEGGQGKRILRLGDSLFAYSEAEYDGSSAANAVNVLKSAGIDAIYCDGVTETHKNGVTFENTQAVTASDGKVYVSSTATLPDIRIAAHEAVHVNDIKGTEAYANYESVVCDNILWVSKEYAYVAETINRNHYGGQYDITDAEFGKLFRRELTAYLNEFLVADPDLAGQKFSKMFDNWDAVVEASRKFNEDIGIDYTIAQSNSNNSGVSEADSDGSAFSMEENSELQSTAKGNELEIETMSFEEDGAEDTTEELSYEEKIMLESSGIDTSVTQKQKRINKIAERLGVKIAWDIDGDPSEVGNGYYENGVIHMNKRAKALATVFAHEYIHHIEQSKLWSSFKKFIEGTKAYKDWITVRGGNSDVEQAEKNYKLRLETSYSKAGKEVADSDVIANFMAERFFGGSFEGDIKSEENAALLLSEISKSDKWYHNIIRWARQMISKFKGDKLGEEFYKMEGLLLKARKDVQKNPTTNTGGRKYSVSNETVMVDMGETERYEILKDKKIQLQKIEVDKHFDIDFKFLEENIKSIVEKPLIKKLRELGYLKNYSTNVIDVNFDLTAGGVRKSLHSQVSDYGGNFADFAKVVLNLQKLLDNSVVLEIHTDKGKGSVKENQRLKQTYVLLSAFVEGNLISPVQFEVKQYIDDSNRLYLAVALTKIETGVMGNTASEKQMRTYLLPVSNISISDLFSKINTKDENFLKYVPNQFLNGEQIKAKNRALERDDVKYSRKNSVTPASEAETIARLAKEGRSAEYVKQRVDASMDAERVAKRWLKVNKSSYDSEKLAAKITRKAGVQALAFFHYM